MACGWSRMRYIWSVGVASRQGQDLQGLQGFQGFQEADWLVFWYSGIVVLPRPRIVRKLAYGVPRVPYLGIWQPRDFRTLAVPLLRPSKLVFIFS